MRCANPRCGQLARDIFAGTLRLVELEVPADARIVGDESGFPICIVPSRYFWLCPACSRTMEVRRWTRTEVVFGPSRELRKRVASVSKPRFEILPEGLTSTAGDLAVRSA